MAIKIRQVNFKESPKYVMVINGGARQDVMQAHFHLFAGDMVAKKGLPKERGIEISLNDKVFWGQFVSELNTLLDKHEISPAAFSVLIQFNENHEVTLYFT